ncbi:MAG: hypothetical protein ACOZCO_02090 [Bacteroidota bacterium]
MKEYILINILLLASVFPVFPQTDTTMNGYDDNGKKHGKWKVYLDEQWAEVSDSSKAIYIRHTYYDHGVNVYPMGPCGRKGWTLEMRSADSSGFAGNKLLNGTFIWKDEKGVARSEHLLKNGEYISCKEYNSSGKLQQYFNYLQHYNNEPFTWFCHLYDKKGKQKSYVMRKGEWGWRLYEESGDDK